ncbi:hypothetical protein NMY22_g5398 [Coprinellus aureogranulatus]|nr:hypothetical protein NMY22_g5398 [Coprinellus aureogranulatus]
MQLISTAFLALAILASVKVCSFILERQRASPVSRHAQIQVSAAATRTIKEGDVFTAKKVIHTLVREAPFMVDITSTIVWTAGPVITATTTPSPIPGTIVKPPGPRSVA